MVASHLKWDDIYPRIDWEKLYDELGWEPIYTRGDEDKGYCLMPQNHTHGDSTGKLAINRAKGLYNCWVCGGGTVVQLVSAVRSLSAQDSLKYLSQFVDSSTKESTDEFTTRVARLLAKETESPRRVSPPVFNPNVLKDWQTPHEWFDSRHIRDGVRQSFQAGFDPVARRYSPEHGTYEGPGIILPHFWGGSLVGWQTRWLDGKPKWLPKYTNTTDFPRETTLWGYDSAATSEHAPIVVESVPTALYLISEGHPAIATFGAQITEAQLRHLRQFQQGVILAPDNDSAGRKWLDTTTKYLERFIPVNSVGPVEGEGADLGDLQPTQLQWHLENTKK